MEWIWIITAVAAGGACLVIALILLTSVVADLLFDDKKGKKMEKIHWNEKAGQIMTKGEECLFDRSKFERFKVALQSRIDEIEKANNEKTKEWAETDTYNDKVEADNAELNRTDELRFNTLQTQLQCQAKTGHKMAYDGEIGNLAKSISDHTSNVMLYGSAIWNLTDAMKGSYRFKCSHCGLTITKTLKELKPSEREALKKLGVI